MILIAREPRRTVFTLAEPQDDLTPPLYLLLLWRFLTSTTSISFNLSAIWDFVTFAILRFTWLCVPGFGINVVQKVLNVYDFFRLFTNVFECLWMFTNIWEWLWMFTSVFELYECLTQKIGVATLCPELPRTVIVNWNNCK